MWFWWYLLVMVLLVPGSMIGFGAYFRRSVPKNINWVFGYRTPRSMKNQDTWIFAHRHIGKHWFRTGWCELVLSVAAMILCYGKDTDFIGYYSVAVSAVQLIFMIISIFLVESALKKNFDENGYRKTEEK